MNAPKSPAMLKIKRKGGDGPDDPTPVSDKPGNYKKSGYGKSWKAGTGIGFTVINEALAKRRKTGATKGNPSPTKDAVITDKPGNYKKSGYGKSWTTGPDGKPMPINETMAKKKK